MIVINDLVLVCTGWESPGGGGTSAEGSLIASFGIVKRLFPRVLGFGRMRIPQLALSYSHCGSSAAIAVLVYVSGWVYSSKCCNHGLWVQISILLFHGNTSFNYRIAVPILWTRELSLATSSRTTQMPRAKLPARIIIFSLSSD